MSVQYPYFCYDCGEFPAIFPMGGAPNEMPCPSCGQLGKRMYEAPAVHWHTVGATKGRIDPFRHRDGSKLTEADKDRVPEHCEKG